MRRRVETLQPFRFESDFSANKTDVPEQVSLSAADLTALLAEARESTAALVRDDTLRAATEHLETISANLHDALSSIVRLAAHLENAAIDEQDRQTALDNIRHLARTLIDGQGELFAKSAPRSPVGNHSDEPWQSESNTR